MIFKTHCTNKGCYQEMRPVIDPDTMKVYCTSCGKEIDNVTIFMKKQMINFKQIKKNQKKGSLERECKNCGKIGMPKWKGDDVACFNCETPFKLSGPFMQLYRVQLPKSR